MKRSIFMLTLIALISCGDDEVRPLEDHHPLVKTVISFAEDSDTITNITYYNYDNQQRLIQVINEKPGWFRPTLTTYEYISDSHIKMQIGDSSYDLFYNEQGDLIRMNDDIYAYIYEEDKVTITLSNDNISWDVICYMDCGNVVRTEEPDYDLTTTMTYDDKPNYQRSIDMGGSLACSNNLLNETTVDGYGMSFEVAYTYQYNDEGYVIEKISKTTSGSYESSRRVEITYY